MKGVFCLACWTVATYVIFSSSSPASAVDQSCAPLRIGAFNIQTFGRKKVSNRPVTDVLVKTVQRYDILLIQEIRDTSGMTLKSFAKAVNTTLRPFGLIFSRPLGKSKEQYAYFFRLDKLAVVTSFVYDGATADTFQRPPFVAEFKGAARFSACLPPFVILGLHAKPLAAVNELSALSTAYDDVATQLSNENAIIMGDFNADCRYFKKTHRKLVTLFTDARFVWLIPDNAGTTVRESKCAYDRIVLVGDWLPRSVVRDSAGIFRFDKAYGLTANFTKEVSDHYPVEFVLDPTKRFSRRHALLSAARLRRVMAMVYGKRFAQLLPFRDFTI